MDRGSRTHRIAVMAPQTRAVAHEQSIGDEPRPDQMANPENETRRRVGQLDGPGSTSNRQLRFPQDRRAAGTARVQVGNLDPSRYSVLHTAGMAGEARVGEPHTRQKSCANQFFKKSNWDHGVTSRLSGAKDRSGTRLAPPAVGPRFRRAPIVSELPESLN